MNRNEAIEIVKKHYPYERHLLLNEALETLIPKLKESEDERIRKSMINYFKGLLVESSKQEFNDFINKEFKEYINWLEKRGEQKSAPFKAEHGKYYYCIKDYFSGGKKQASKGNVVQALRGLPIMGLDDASEFFLPVNDIIQLNNNINHNDRPKFKVGDWIVYDKYGTKDVDRIVKFDHDIVRFESSTWLFVYQLNQDCKLWTIEDAEGGDVLSCENGWTCIFKALDNHTNTFSSYCFMDKEGWFCECGGQGHTLDDRICGEIHPATKEQRDLLFQKMKEAGYEWDSEKKELKKIEQKPVDEVETKFKVGNWYLCVKDFLGKGVRFDKGKAYHCGHDGCLQEFDSGAHICIDEKLYEYFRPWTIQDVKDGDILCTYECDKPKIVFILKGAPKKHYALSYYCYYNIMYPYFGFDSEHGCLAPNVEDVKPATKEQRDLLFQKMGEEGYEWDNENKILTKIEKVPTPIEKKQVNWKPTKEQLRQLDAAVGAFTKGSKTHTELRSLSEDLKKLK